MDFWALAYTVSTWIIPGITAITLHEAAHGFAAYRLGDDTAYRAGRMTLNPFRHVDSMGTIILPALLLVTRAPFLFGYAKPVPVDFSRLDHPRRDMVWVALAGPATNLALAIVAALLFNFVSWLPSPDSQKWVADNLANALLINVVLAVFNMLPIPPLDGGRVAVGLLPDALAMPLARIEPAGIYIVLGFLFVLPWLGAQIGLSLDLFSWLVGSSAEYLIELIAGLADLG